MCDVNESIERLQANVKEASTPFPGDPPNTVVSVRIDDLVDFVEAYDQQAEALAAADALRDWLLTKYVKDGTCPVCSRTAEKFMDYFAKVDGFEKYVGFFHAGDCLIVAYDATRPHNPPQPYEDRPGSTP